MREGRGNCGGDVIIIIEKNTVFNSTGYLHLRSLTLIKYVHLHSNIPCFLNHLLMGKHASHLV